MFAKSRTKRIVAIDWDARVLRVVHAVLGGKGVKIERLLSSTVPSDVDPDDAEQLGRHIRRTLDQEGIATRHAIVDIPRDQAILKTLKLPTNQPDELPSMVEIQIAKELPFPVREAVVDFTTDGTTSGEVLVAAVRREVLAHYESIFAAADLKLDRVGLRPYANKVAVGKLLRHAMPERVLFIDVRPTFMEIDILKDGALAFSRSASVTIPTGGGSSPVLPITGGDRLPISGGAVSAASGGDEPVSAEGVIPSLVREVTRSIEAYRADDPGATIDHVVIGGDLGVEDALCDAIQKRLEITAEIYNPASTFGWEPDEGVEAAAFAASLGLVLAHQDPEASHFDFLHPKRTVSAAQERLKKVPLVAAVILLFLAAGGVGIEQTTRPLRRKLAHIEQEISELEGQQKRSRKFLAVLDRVKEFDSGQHVWIDILYDVVSILPSNQEVVLNQVETNQKQNRLTLKTRTKKRDTAIRIIGALQDFRREDRDAPRFRVSMGTQTEKKGEKYPFHQDLRIQILDDSPSGRKSSTSTGGG